jgi:hypothetical protein
VRRHPPAAACDNPGQPHPSDHPSLAMPDLRHGIVTFIFSDIEGSFGT